MKTYIKRNFLLSIFFVLAIACSNENENALYHNNSSPLSRQMVRPVIISKIQIGAQIWMTENLKVSRYRNGDLITQVQDPDAFTNMTTGAWCYYANSSYNGAIYGKLYNWYAVVDPRGLAPEGWHIPNDLEWENLANYLGGLEVAGGKLKSTTLWNSPNIGASNITGFNALPGGELQFGFQAIGISGFWWSSTQADEIFNYAGAVSMQSNSAALGLESTGRYNGFSVRCVKD